MGEARVPRAAAVVALAPGDRMVVVDRVRAVGLGVGGLVHRQQHVHARRVARAVVVAAAVDHRVLRRLVVVPLVRARPAGRDAGRGRVGGVLHDGRRGRRAVRVVAEVRAHQLAVPRPAVLGVGRGVDAGVAAARADEALERRLLGVVEHVTGGREEDHRVVVAEDVVGEPGRVLGGVDLPVLVGAELAERGDARADRVVPEAGGLREHQGAQALAGIIGREHGHRRRCGWPRRPCRRRPSGGRRRCRPWSGCRCTLAPRASIEPSLSKSHR